MTQEDIIRMAWEAGFWFNGEPSPVIERFFNLAFEAGAAHEREHMSAELMNLAEKVAYSTIEAVESEREACAKIADAELMNTNMLASYPPKSSAAWNVANAIRARGEK